MDSAIKLRMEVHPECIASHEFFLRDSCAVTGVGTFTGLSIGCP